MMRIDTWTNDALSAGIRYEHIIKYETEGDIPATYYEAVANRNRKRGKR